MATCVCGDSEVFIIDEATTPNTEYANTVNPLAIAAAWVPSGGGFLGAGGKRIACSLSARVCAKCGRVEWFVKDLETLARFAADRLAGVRRGKR